MIKRDVLRQLTYGQMRELIALDDDTQVSGYISDNLAIMKGSPFELLTHLTSGPFRFDEMRLLIAGQGRARPVINLLPLEVHAGDLVFVSGGSVAQISDASPDVKAKGMSCTNELLALAFDNRLPTILKLPRLSFVVHLSQDERFFIETLHSLLWQAVHDKEMSAPFVLRLVSTLLTYVDHLYLLSEQRHIATSTHEEQIFDRFMALVNQYGAREHRLNFYADKICLSQRYLGTIVKKMSGRTAKEWIDKAVILEAKVMLKHSDMPVSHVADELNFDNFSFFCRYFRRLTGLSPQQYRET